LLLSCEDSFAERCPDDPVGDGVGGRDEPAADGVGGSDEPVGAKVGGGDETADGGAAGGDETADGGVGGADEAVGEPVGARDETIGAFGSDETTPAERLGTGVTSSVSARLGSVSAARDSRCCSVTSATRLIAASSIGVALEAAAGSRSEVALGSPVPPVPIAV
jgi:hypothetical protein